MTIRSGENEVLMLHFLLHLVVELFTFLNKRCGLTVCNIKRDTMLVRLITSIFFIIMDEALIAHRKIGYTFNMALCDHLRLILPVIRGTKIQILDAAITKYYIYLCR
jgi:hypothetical protein